MNSKVDYLDNPWKPVPQTVIRDKTISNEVEEIGFSVKNMIPEESISELLELYSDTHQINEEHGGMFYSVYSQNLDYRKQIHDKIGAILAPIVREQFKDYRVLLNSFVIKASGSKSEFCMHQDTTGLDELTHSPVSLWIPLDDVDESNGCLWVLPKSHGFFSPYRSISFPAPYEEIQDDVKRYLQPVKMKKGEALFFDNRLVHHSFGNETGKTRIAVVCGLFPQDAKLLTCHKPESTLAGKVELIEHDDDFLLKHPNFLFDCQKRPDTGVSKGWVEDNYQSIDLDGFKALCLKHNIVAHTETPLPVSDCNLISEPD
ncbi:MAG: hypothetical protein ACI9EQ_000331 [Bacteroidia bacterium]|jgi:hypothetical protein